MRRENITSARPVKMEILPELDNGKVQYSVLYYTDFDMENMFITYEGEPSARFWNLTRLIASQMARGKK